MPAPGNRRESFASACLHVGRSDWIVAEPRVGVSSRAVRRRMHDLTSNPSRSEIDLLCLRAAPLASYNIMLEDPRGSRAQQSPEKVRSSSPAHGPDPQRFSHPLAADYCSSHTLALAKISINSFGNLTLQRRTRFWKFPWKFDPNRAKFPGLFGLQTRIPK